jgi:hypothetical protein
MSKAGERLRRRVVRRPTVVDVLLISRRDMTERTGPKLTAQMSLSLDGCHAGPRHDGERRDMAGWMSGPEAPGFSVTRWVIDAMSLWERQGFAGGEQSVASLTAAGTRSEMVGSAS